MAYTLPTRNVTRSIRATGTRASPVLPYRRLQSTTPRDVRVAFRPSDGKQDLIVSTGASKASSNGRSPGGPVACPAALHCHKASYKLVHFSFDNLQLRSVHLRTLMPALPRLCTIQSTTGQVQVHQAQEGAAGEVQQGKEGRV